MSTCQLLTHRMTTLIADITERLGAWKAADRGALLPKLHPGKRIRNLQAPLAIEQNTLSVEQVTAALVGKPVLGSLREVQEVQDSFAAYEAMERWRSTVERAVAVAVGEPAPPCRPREDRRWEVL